METGKATWRWRKRPGALELSLVVGRQDLEHVRFDLQFGRRAPADAGPSTRCFRRLDSDHLRGHGAVAGGIFGLAAVGAAANSIAADQRLGRGSVRVRGRRAVRGRQTGRAVPLILGTSLLTWTLGDVVVTIESLGGATVPQPSIADAFYLVYF